MSLALLPEGSTQAAINASSRGGIGMDIAGLPGHKWNIGPSNATTFYTYGDR